MPARCSSTHAAAGRDPQGLSGWLEYDTDLFHRPSIAPQINQLRNLLEGVVRDPGLRLRELPLLAPVELHQVVDLPSARAPCSCCRRCRRN